MTNLCTKCGKPETRFYGRSKQCRSCERKKILQWRKNNPEKLAIINRRARLKIEYGLSEQQVQQMFIDQKNKCKICEREKILVIDHCHNSGKVRGLLCYSCNTLLGHIENEEKMKRVRQYLNEEI